ncbi:MAG: hypothetical protein RR434_05810, partial [Raoultibacter sp.]
MPTATAMNISTIIIFSTISFPYYPTVSTDKTDKIEFFTLLRVAHTRPCHPATRTCNFYVAVYEVLRKVHTAIRQPAVAGCQMPVCY